MYKHCQQTITQYWDGLRRQCGNIVKATETYCWKHKPKEQIMEQKHTELPWKWDKYMGGDEHVKRLRAANMEPTLSLTNDGATPIMGSDGSPVAFVCLRRDDVKPSDKWNSDDPGREANARFIVKAANSHKALLDACREAQGYFEGQKIRTSAYKLAEVAVLNSLDAALALARKEAE